MMMDFLKIKKLYFVNSKVSNFNRDSDITCWEPCFLVQKFKFFQLMLCQKTKIRLTNLKYINNIFSIQVRAETGGGLDHAPMCPTPLVGWNGRNTRALGCAYNSQYSRTPYYVKRDILNVLRHGFHIAKYVLNIWTLHEELEKRIDKCTLIGFCIFIYA